MVGSKKFLKCHNSLMDMDTLFKTKFYEINHIKIKRRLEMMRDNEKFEEMQLEMKGIEYKTIGEILIIVAVIMYIIGAFSFLVLPFNTNINVFIFGLIMAGATAIIMYGSFQLKFYYKLNRNNPYLKIDENRDKLKLNATNKGSLNIEKKALSKKRKNTISGMIRMCITMIYLYIGFVFGFWHPGWLIFMLIPMSNILLDVIKVRN